MNFTVGKCQKHINQVGTKSSLKSVSRLAESISLVKTFLY